MELPARRSKSALTDRPDGARGPQAHRAAADTVDTYEAPRKARTNPPPRPHPESFKLWKRHGAIFGLLNVVQSMTAGTHREGSRPCGMPPFDT